MKKTVLAVTIVALVLALSVTLVYAQAQRGTTVNQTEQGAAITQTTGPGMGMGARMGRIGQPCPYGYTQPNPNPAGRWTRMQPTTPDQQAFVDTIAPLHLQIREKQFELANLRASNGDAKRIAALEQEIYALRTQLRDMNYQNRDLRWQMGQTGRGMMGGKGMNRAPVRGPGQDGMGMQGHPMGRGPGMGQGRMAGLNPNCPWR